MKLFGLVLGLISFIGVVVLGVYFVERYLVLEIWREVGFAGKALLFFLHLGVIGSIIIQIFNDE